MKLTSAQAERLLSGTVLAVDPSSGGTSGLGFAFYKGGKLQQSWSEDRLKGTISERLRQLSDILAAFKRYDFLAIERLPSRVHHYVLWAVGVIVSTVPHDELVQVDIKAWKEVAREDETYSKGDEADARCMGEALVRAARRFLEQDSSGRRSSTSRRVRNVVRKGPGRVGKRRGRTSRGRTGAKR